MGLAHFREAAAARSGLGVSGTTSLLLGFAGAFRRSQTVGLTVGNATFHRATGLHMPLRTWKTDQETHGRVVALPYEQDPATCPPSAWVR